MQTPAPYNPLERINLARSVETTLLEQACDQMPLGEAFRGAGIYALYYQGKHKLYQPISSSKCEAPIYVGKAVPAGSRRGLVDLSAEVGPVLYNRIRQHANSLAATKDLDPADFRCRYLVVEDIFILMTEALLIQHFRPLWNVHVAGFGIHQPGSRRWGGDRSEWDELHPGRAWYKKMRQVRTRAQVAAKIRKAFADRDTATKKGLPAHQPPVAVEDED